MRLENRITSLDADQHDGDVEQMDETVADPKIRRCLSCEEPFPSGWAGERICKKCKSSAAWRSG